ncbi:hypothetical protein L5515_003926 [Caenorhabditis briggsae]|uniref:Uncharacterized protein n=1 Tax=Caenorhabditis briggsae TaxID=6238 RepID=A0AAE9JCM3_CAEBR|nr:hypothetical protein L5515_003926 [Caenorhabditis briggsae]
MRRLEVVKHGFEFFHKQQLLTIFGACNNSENNKAVQSCLTSEGMLTFRRFQSLDGLEDGDDDDLTEGEEEIAGCLFALLILIGTSVGGYFFWNKRSAKEKEKEDAQHADNSKEREQQLKKMANTTNDNSGVNRTPTKVTKPAKKAPGKKAAPNATSGKDGPCFVL